MPPEKISQESVMEVEIDLKGHPVFIDMAAGESETKTTFYVTSYKWDEEQKITCDGFAIPLWCEDFEIVARDYEMRWHVTLKRDKIYRRFYRNHYRVKHVRERQIDNKVCYMKWRRAKKNHENPIAFGQIRRWKRRLRRIGK